MEITAILLFFLFGFHDATALCSFTKTEENGLPTICNPNDQCAQPAPRNFTPFQAACPQYADLGCCNNLQNGELYINFQLLDVSFGQAAQGGCPACAANLRAFFCEYTCSPNQADFVAAQGYKNVSDPVRKINTTVLVTNVTFSHEFACAMSVSCRDTKPAKLQPELQSFQGLMQYFSDEEIDHHVIMPYTLSASADKHAALSPPWYSCCNYPVNMSNPSAGNTSCPCETCGGMCSDGPETCFSQPASRTSVGCILLNPINATADVASS